MHGKRFNELKDPSSKGSSPLEGDGGDLTDENQVPIFAISAKEDNILLMITDEDVEQVRR